MGTSNMGSASAAAIARRPLTEFSGPDVEERVLRRCVCIRHTGCMGVSLIMRRHG